MEKQLYQFAYEVYATRDDLAESDRNLLTMAQDATRNAYAPYSQFYVGAAAVLANGQFETGTNQENASYPAGICAERVLLSSVASHYPGAVVQSIAITYDYHNSDNDRPISPCGICRQSLVEQEEKQLQPVRLILGGKHGKVIIISTAAALLPMAFRKGDLI